MSIFLRSIFLSVKIMLRKRTYAEIVVTDHETVCSDGAEIIREYDFERLRALMG